MDLEGSLGTIIWIWEQNNRAGKLWLFCSFQEVGDGEKETRKPHLFSQKSPSNFMKEEEAAEKWERKAGEDKEMERKTCYMLFRVKTLELGQALQKLSKWLHRGGASGKGKYIFS